VPSEALPSVALLATGVPSTVHEVLGCVQMVFSASWVTFVSNPLAKPLFWAFSTVTVLPFPFPLPSLSLALSFLSSCPGFFWAAANAGCVAATVANAPTTNVAAIKTATSASFCVVHKSPTITMSSVYLT
jgi:hypothetical protein